MSQPRWFEVSENISPVAGPGTTIWVCRRWRNDGKIEYTVSLMFWFEGDTLPENATHWQPNPKPSLPKELI